jgi:hypothetical protein
VGEQTRAAEAVGDGAARQRGEVAERRDPELLERLHERRRLLAAAQQLDGMRSEVSRPGDPAGAPDACARRGHEGAEACRTLPDPGAGQHPPQALAAVLGEVAVGEHLHDTPGVQTLQAVRVEVRLARSQRLDRRAEALQPRDRPLPRLGDAHRIRRHERQARAARQRLPHPHPGVDPEGLGGLRDRADEQLAAGLRREGRRLAEQPRAATRRNGELESLEQDADDRHANRCSHQSRRGASGLAG